MSHTSRFQTNRSYDKESGLVFSEDFARIAPASDRQWTTYVPISLRPDFLSVRLDRYKWMSRALNSYQKFVEEQRLPRSKGFRGARSLQGTITEFVLRHLDKLSFEGVQCLPPHIIRSLWDDINKRNILNFHTWTIFSRLLHAGDNPQMRLFRYRQAITEPSSRLKTYIEPLVSKSFQFLAYISITTPFPMSEMVKLSEVENIGILEIIDPNGENPDQSFPFVGDRLVRAWSELANSKGAFPVLRILKLWNHTEVTDGSLQYLNCFPALAVFDTKLCSFSTKRSRATAQRVGWKMVSSKSALEILEEECMQREKTLYASSQITPRPRANPRPLGNFEPIVQADGKNVKRWIFRGTEPIIQNSMASTEWHVLESDLFREQSSRETWEFKAFTAFARIGELRDDADLEPPRNSHSNLHVSAAKANDRAELICPIPMACIRLGPEGKLHPLKYFNGELYHSYHEEAHTENLVFLRINFMGESQRVGGSPSANLSESGGPSLPKRKGPRAGVIRPQKRQKVSDILKDFS